MHPNANAEPFLLLNMCISPSVSLQFSKAFNSVLCMTVSNTKDTHKKPPVCTLRGFLYVILYLYKLIKIETLSANQDKGTNETKQEKQKNVANCQSNTRYKTFH